LKGSPVRILFARPTGNGIRIRSEAADGQLSSARMPHMRIMVFLHGTAIMHQAAVGVPRAERVRQSARRDPSVTDFGSYLPSESAVDKSSAWQRRGADICYLSSHRAAAEVNLDRAVLRAHGFPAGPVYFRAPGETYADVARRARADVLVEDDCQSIGGASQTTASLLGPAPPRIHCVVVPEFGGLAHLPDEPSDLLAI
jgi:hypothetical protein